jgi:hypothetical protein
LGFTRMVTPLVLLSSFLSDASGSGRGTSFCLGRIPLWGFHSRSYRWLCHSGRHPLIAMRLPPPCQSLVKCPGCSRRPHTLRLRGNRRLGPGRSLHWRWPDCDIQQSSPYLPSSCSPSRRVHALRVPRGHGPYGSWLPLFPLQSFASSLFDSSGPLRDCPHQCVTVCAPIRSGVDDRCGPTAALRDCPPDGHTRCASRIAVSFSRHGFGVALRDCPLHCHALRPPSITVSGSPCASDVYPGRQTLAFCASPGIPSVP